MHKPESVQGNEIQKILWDFEIQSDYSVSARRSDLVLINKKKKMLINKKKKKKKKEEEKKTLYLVEFSLPADHWEWKWKKAKRLKNNCIFCQRGEKAVDM